MTYWLLGFAMMLVVEGLMPLIFPEMWREALSKLLTLSNGQLRFMGLAGMLSGLLLMYWIK